MEDTHRHAIVRLHHHDSNSNLLFAFLLNLLFVGIELAGRMLTGSVVILSDVVHDMGDVLSLGVALVFEALSKKGANKRYTYGYKRLSLIGALFNVVVLVAGTVVICTESISALRSPQAVNTSGMIALAIIGILIKGLSALRLGYSKRILDKTVWIHILKDLFSWVAVLITSIVIHFTQWYMLDPILALVICAIIVKTVIDATVSIYTIMMQAVPDKRKLEQLEQQIKSASDAIVCIEQLHLWSLDGEQQVFSCRLVLTHLQDQAQIVARVKALVQAYGVVDATVEVAQAGA